MMFPHPSTGLPDYNENYLQSPRSGEDKKFVTASRVIIHVHSVSFLSVVSKTLFDYLPSASSVCLFFF